MSYYTRGRNHIVVKKHVILPFLRIAKCGFFLVIVFFLYILSVNIIPLLEGPAVSSIKYIVFFFIFALLNYAFIKLILGLIQYYNNIIIVSQDSLVIIHCSLILQDDVEVIDAYRVVKVDSFARGFFANLLGYGDIVMEQQKNEVRTFHFVPNPYKFLEIIKQQRENLLNSKPTQI